MIIIKSWRDQEFNANSYKINIIAFTGNNWVQKLLWMCGIPLHECEFIAHEIIVSSVQKNTSE